LFQSGLKLIIIIRFRIFAKNKILKRLISVVGPTGIGKTKLAIEIAKSQHTEIISCDSRQFYKEMKIGTAVPSDEELAEVPHHFIGNLSIHDYYSIGQFEKEALDKLDELFLDHDVIIMVGGSGMYEKAVVDGMNDLPEADEDNQKLLQFIFENEGIEPLQNLLRILDPDYYNNVDLENPRRLFRSLDIIFQTGKSYSENLDAPKIKRNFETIRIGIDAPREVIYDRINRRVDIMMEQGLLEEAKTLLSHRDKVALQTVGYTELFRYIDDEWTLDFAIEEIKKNSRRYAKRQITWNKKLVDVNWVNYENSVEESLSLLHKIL